MKRYRSLSVGDQVIAVDPLGEQRRVVVATVPAADRDGSGSFATTDRGGRPRAWVRFGDSPPVPWPLADLHWPAQAPTPEGAP